MAESTPVFFRPPEKNGRRRPHRTDRADVRLRADIRRMHSPRDACFDVNREISRAIVPA